MKDQPVFKIREIYQPLRLNESVSDSNSFYEIKIIYKIIIILNVKDWAAEHTQLHKILCVLFILSLDW